MFRIKTDIRQYKCEDQDKVESLIRNWVIRPNDLIYIEDQDSWSPIGEHPEFTTLFSQMNDLDGLEEGSDELLSKALEAATNLLDESAE